MDSMKKYKGTIIRIAFVIIFFQFMSMVEFFIINNIKFKWLGMPPEFSFWTFLLVSIISFLIVADYVGDEEEKN